MVQVASEPSEETEPILGKTGSSNECDDVKTMRKNSYKEEAYKLVTRSSVIAANLTVDNPKLAFELFETAVKVQNMMLAKQCVAILNDRIDKNNVLQILMQISRCRKGPETDPIGFEPSAPPFVEKEDEKTENCAQELLDNLKHNCLLEIDKNADHVLKQKEIIELSYNDLLAITTRDTLQVSSEMVVYSAIMRWCMNELKRETLQAQVVNMKAFLRELVYAPRYGLMSKKEFLTRTIDGVKGPDRSGILDEGETNRILEYIKMKEKGRKKLTEELPFKGSQERRAGNLKPKILSFDGKDGGKRCDSPCERALIGFLACWSAVFD